MKKFFAKEGKKLKEIHERMNATYGDVSPFFYQVKFWFKQFKWGTELIEDNSRSGQPMEASCKGSVPKSGGHDFARSSC